MKTAKNERQSNGGSKTASDRGSRRVSVERNTSESRIKIALALDGTGRRRIKTPIPFLDHMLDLLAKHAFLDLKIDAAGDTHIDDHHTVEDIGIVLGRTLSQALGAKQSIARFGYAYAPMDEALARAVIDISGRPFVDYQAPSLSPTLGGERIFHTDLIEEFWRAVVANAAITLHLDLLRGRNAHHSIEAMFKAFALAWYQATRPTGQPGSVPSTKGVIE